MVLYPRYGALPGPCVPLRVARGVLIALQYIIRFLAAEPRSTAAGGVTGGFQEQG